MNQTGNCNMDSPSLRERQKIQTRQEMLVAAQSLFSRDGYSKTTMQSIADETGVGIATLFRYFPKKISILAALSRKEMEEIFTVSDQIADSPRDNVEEAIAKLITSYVGLLEKPSKNLPNSKPLVLGIKTGKTEIDEVIDWADRKMKRQIHQMLSHFRDNGKLRKELSLNDLVEIIFAVVNQHYINYVTERDTNTGKLKRDTSRRIKILFKSWIESS